MIKKKLSINNVPNSEIKHNILNRSFNVKNKYYNKIVTDFLSNVLIEKDIYFNDFLKQIGKVIYVGDGIAKVIYLYKVKLGEMVYFSSGLKGIALNLESDIVSIVLFGSEREVKVGDIAYTSGTIIKVLSGFYLLGSVVNGIGSIISLNKEESYNFLNEGYTKSFIDVKAPGVITRQSVNRSLLTGYKIIDSVLPIGRGQRQLIIGDRQTGKTALAVDTIINQKNTDVFCVYVGIGLKRSSLIQLYKILNNFNVMQNKTVIVSATASEAAPLQYLAPYVGCSIAEYFRDRGLDSLIIYDDLSKHAVAYRQMSLLLRRPSGREAYPGDIFYAHSRLLERACQLSDVYLNGSLTALPIVETQLGDVAAYIPTNVISITDGQIYLEGLLFNQGIRPAVNTGLSVSRVGSAAQCYMMKILGKELKLELAKFREFSSYIQFGSDVDAETQALLDRGQMLTNMLIQPRFKPLKIYEQALIIFLGLKGYLNGLNLDQIKIYEENILSFLNKDFYFRPLIENMENLKKFDINNNIFFGFINYYINNNSGLFNKFHSIINFNLDLLNNVNVSNINFIKYYDFININNISNINSFLINGYSFNINNFIFYIRDEYKNYIYNFYNVENNIEDDELDLEGNDSFIDDYNYLKLSFSNEIYNVNIIYLNILFSDFLFFKDNLNILSLINLFNLNKKIYLFIYNLYLDIFFYNSILFSKNIKFLI